MGKFFKIAKDKNDLSSHHITSSLDSNVRETTNNKGTQFVKDVTSNLKDVDTDTGQTLTKDVKEGVKTNKRGKREKEYFTKKVNITGIPDKKDLSEAETIKKGPWGGSNKSTWTDDDGQAWKQHGFNIGKLNFGGRKRKVSDKSHQRHMDKIGNQLALKEGRYRFKDMAPSQKGPIDKNTKETIPFNQLPIILQQELMLNGLPNKLASLEKTAVGTKMFAIPVGSMVENINPSCSHKGSIGKVVKAYPHQTTYIVKNKGKTFKPGDRLTKTNGQLKKVAQATPASIAGLAQQNNNPIVPPPPPVVTNTAVNTLQTPIPDPPSPPEGNSQGQNIKPQKPKGKFMNRNNLDIKKNAG